MRSRLALKHGLEIRELQAATFRTMLVKQDEPSMQASKAATELFVTKSKEGQRPPGEPHVYGWAAMMTALTTDTALSAEDKQKVAAYTSSANSPETLLQCIYWSQFKKKNISEGLGQVAVFRGPPDSAHLVPQHQSHESEGRQREVRPGSSGEQRSRTPTNARRSLTQPGDKRGGQQSLTSWLRLKTPSTVQSSTEDSGGGQRLLTPLDATKVISSSSSVCGAGPCRGVHPSSSSRESYRVSSCGKIHLSCSSG